MKHIRYMILGTLFGLAGLSSVFAQQLDAVLAQAHKRHEQQVVEKLYLHLDKPSYTAGEDVWIKIYGTIGVENYLSNFSSMVYVELIGPDDNKVVELKVPLVRGMGVADLHLQDTIMEGSYRLRAYTNWMRNSDPVFFYDRTIPITNGRSDGILVSAAYSEQEASDRYDFQLRKLNGERVSHTEVAFELVQDGKVVKRQKAKTDAQGDVSLALSHVHRNAVVRYRITTAEGYVVKKVLLPVAKDMPDAVVQLFPEGGKLVAGYTNRIAAKAVNERGLGVRAQVLFLDGRDTLARLETNALGMGAVLLPVSIERKIKAVARFEDGRMQEVAMPDVQPSGLVLQLRSDGGAVLDVKVGLKQNLTMSKELAFVVHYMGKVYSRTTVAIGDRMLDLKLQTKDFPNGVLTMTVLADNGKPLAERAFFHYNSTHLSPLSLEVDRAVFSFRENVSVNLNLDQDTENGRIGVFSASVVKLDKLDSTVVQQAPNILSTLLLTSDIKGFVEQPKFYFARSVPRYQDIDYLLLTQGWRSIDWQTPDTAEELKYNVEKGQKIRGYVRKLNRKTPEKDVIVRLFPQKNLNDFMQTKSEADGYFEFDGLFFTDRMGYIVSAREAGQKDKVRLELLEDEEMAAVTESRNRSLEQNNTNLLYRDQLKSTNLYFKELEKKGLMKGAIHIDEVLVERRKNPISSRSQNIHGPGNADHIMTAKDLEDYSLLRLALWDRFAHRFDWTLHAEAPRGALFILDGRRIDSLDVGGIDAEIVESVEVLEQEFMIARYNDVEQYSCVFIITTKPDAKTLSASSPARVTVVPPPLHISRRFYKPAYDVIRADEVPFRDLRTTIHWEPSIVVSKSGKTSFDFYTADEPGTYEVLVEGLDIAGTVMYEVLRFEVK